MPSKTTLWFVELMRGEGKFYIRVGKTASDVAIRTQRIRTISASAAAKKYIKGTLNGVLYEMDDGYHSPSEIIENKEDREYANNYLRRTLMLYDHGRLRVVVDKTNDK
jgi:hypothetical protein